MAIHREALRVERWVLIEVDEWSEVARRATAESLDLGDLELSALPVGLGALSHLRTLCLGGLKLTEPGDLVHDEERSPPAFTDLSPLVRLQQLRTLDLSGCQDVRDVTP